MTEILCTECGDTYNETAANYFVCVGCGHDITTSDIVLDEGESLTIRGGVVGYTVTD